MNQVPGKWNSLIENNVKPIPCPLLGLEKRYLQYRLSLPEVVVTDLLLSLNGVLLSKDRLNYCSPCFPNIPVHHESLL